MTRITLPQTLIGLAAAIALLIGPAEAQQGPKPAGGLSAAEANAKNYFEQNAERGWWWYDTPAIEPEPTAPPPDRKTATAPQKPDDKCGKSETWTADCGFVDPGDSFEFQSKQRDALLERMSMSNNDPKAVEAFQYYMKWAVDRSLHIANLWQYNMVQNPDLDPNVSEPVSALGLRLMSEAKSASARDIFRVLRNDAILVFFSRSDCVYCHGMLDPLRKLEENTGISVWNASLDGQCLKGFKDKCMTGEGTAKPAGLLQVKTVPTVFLYVKPNTWIRIANGISSASEMSARMATFFSAYRAAMQKGLDNGTGVRPAVDFSAGEGLATKSGVATMEARLPSQNEIDKLLGKSAN